MGQYIEKESERMELMLFLTGGLVYTCIEILWRGYTHWSMFILGGVCFVIMGLLNEYKIPWHWCLLRQSVMSAVIITVFEFFTGCVVNLWLGWGVWDYSDLPFSLYGQVCLYFFLLWIPLSAVGIALDDWIRYLVYIWLHKYIPWMQERERPALHNPVTWASKTSLPRAGCRKMALHVRAQKFM